MKNKTAKLLMLLSVLFLGALFTREATGEYIWVKDKQVSSRNVLPSSLSSRMVPLSESKALETVRGIMGEEMSMTISKYDKRNRLQAAQTSPKTLLPEEIAGQGSRELAGEDYMFILEVQVKESEGQTRITAKAWPIYRVPERRSGDRKNKMEIKVETEPGQTVAMGPMIILPVIGRPADYDAKILPDAGQRAGNLVRYFMQALDRAMRTEK
jgi:hypothetical protein